tara:strand:+ start:419 stop:1126 length:708 start_codon:yes stop_codon:yes gene_type:complete
MPNFSLYGGTEVEDGQSSNGGPGTAGTSWANIRNATTGSFSSDSFAIISCSAALYSGRGANFYDVARAWLWFDFSAFTPGDSGTEITDIVLCIYRHGGPNTDVWAVRHDAPSCHVSTVEHVFFPSHDPAGGDSMTAYSSVNTEGTGDYNTFTLNATAIAEANACKGASGNGGYGNKSFEVALVAGQDYSNTEPTDNTESANFRSQNYSGTGSDPYLKVVYTVAGADNATFFGANF